MGAAAPAARNAIHCQRMLRDLEHLASSGLAELSSAASAAALEQWRIRYLGTKGALKQIMPRLEDVPPAEKPRIGARLNEVKSELESAFERKKDELGRAGSGRATAPFIDITEPGHVLGQGRRHVLSRTIDEITDVFAQMGFSVATGPEVEDERHNFDALNIPRGHPAREPTDNFYLSRGADEAGIRMLRTQTSTVQIRAMEASRPPLKVIAVGRVYRPDTHDATHYSMFHQVEGLFVDRDVSMVDLKTTLFQFARAYFGPGAEVRMRPSYFPFTEPSAEVDMRMRVRGQYQWVELGGCGMVDPNVFEAVGYDSEAWTGFAFGLGIERIAMRKYGIADIRWLFENDARFLRQFF
jgi:phenylalanyl-tRNA synthetase alpha chain